MMEANNIINRLHWFPKSPSHFITWGSEINMYEVKNAGNDHIIDNSSQSSKFIIFFIFNIIIQYRYFIFNRYKFRPISNNSIQFNSI